MNDLPDVVVLSATRTAIGKYGGGLAGVPPCDLAATVVREAVRRAAIEPADVGHAVFGHVIHTEARDMYLGRVAAVNGGLPVTTPAFTVNRLCGSGLQAIVSAAQAIQLGDADAAVAGGTESMSRAQYWLPGLRQERVRYLPGLPWSRMCKASCLRLPRWRPSCMPSRRCRPAEWPARLR